MRHPIDRPEPLCARRHFAVLLLALVALVVAFDACADPLFAQRADTVDTSGHTRLKVFGGVYGSYLGITIPIAAQASDAMFYSVGLLTGPGLGLAAASSYAGSHGFGEGDAIALSSLTWFGAMQGHLWGASADLEDGSAEVGFGVLGSLAGFVAGISSTGARDYTAGHAAALGAGNWWGAALGWEAARASEDASGSDLARGAAVGSAIGLGVGALAGRGCTHNDIRYLHIGGALGWAYSTGIVVLEEPDRTGESVTQMAGIGAGLAAGLLASKYHPWSARPGLDLDQSGRLRAQAFAMVYGGYLATVIPLASGVEWWNDDTRRTYALAYMHAPAALFLGTTYFTRNTSVSKADALAVSGLTWFGALQGAMWGGGKTGRDRAGWSATGSAAGLGAGIAVARYAHPSEAQAAMLGAGNWWGSWLGTLVGTAVLGEDVDDDAISNAVATGGIVGVAVAAPLGAHMSLRQVRTMHVGGLAGLLFGAGSLLGQSNIGVRTANMIMAITTLGGLAIGANLESGPEDAQARSSFDVHPFIVRRAGLRGGTHTVVGLSFDH